MRFWSLQHSHSVGNKLPTNEKGTVYSFVLNNSEGSHLVEIKYQRMKRLQCIRLYLLFLQGSYSVDKKRTIIEWKSNSQLNRAYPICEVPIL